MERLRTLWLPVAAATLLLAAIGASIAAEPGQAEKCSPVCLPPPEEESEEEPPPPPKPPPPPTRPMLVIGVGWNTGDPRTSSGLQPLSSSLSNTAYVGHLSGRVNEFFANQAAPAPFAKWQVTRGGEFMIEPPQGIVPPGERDQRCAAVTEKGEADAIGGEFVGSVVSQAEAKARQSGIDPDAFTTLIIHYSNTRVQCFNGVHAGRHTLLADPGAARHELGHYEGLGHAGLLRCRDAAGRPVPLSTDCDSSTYNDPYSVMGGRTERAFGAIHANKLGWLKEQLFDVTGGDFTRTYFLRPYTGSVRADRALRLRDGGSSYWLEYRTLDGVDDPAFGSDAGRDQVGLVIHREPSPGESQLLDMTPGSMSFRDDGFDAQLTVGRSWDVPGGEMRITVNSAGPEGVSVTLSSRRVVVPDVRGLDVERAYSILRGLGFNPPPPNPVINPACNYIGLVAEQEPFPGTRWLPEQPMRLGVGVAPPFPCP